MKDAVKEYYGKVLQGTKDLKTDACCTDTEIPGFIKQGLCRIHAEVAGRYYGCGLVMPELLQGMRILDLGCGAGRDCFLLSQLVGEEGYVLGVDMTDEQLAVANRHIDYHTKQFGFSRPNVEFRKGYIEQLNELGLADNSFDIIISNCVINLSPDKEAVLREAYRILKPGGELYFSDVYSDRRISKELAADPVLFGECLSGALYWNDFHNLAKQVGFLDPRLVEDRPLTIGNDELAKRIDYIHFFSATYRLFKLPGLEPHCEDYGQAVIYKGTIPHYERQLQFDKQNLIQAGTTFPVSGNTFRMLSETRFAAHFEFFGADDTHYGIFKGKGAAIPFDKRASNDKSGGACC
ncbi:MAG: methyltransferase domain-containing protein [Candidatus Polarisedimenticolaceae bacterium]|nr:methyltransferase domain-containing protein [Candidatus Polarisedimenticolaceae bacterium]